MAAVIEHATVGEIQRELCRLRDELTAPGHSPRIRTSVMTHVSWVPDRWVDEAMETLMGLQERHPSRVIVLLPRPDDPRDALEAEVDLRCFLRGGEQREVCAEVVLVRLCGKRAHAPGSVVAPLLVLGLPVFLRWRGPLAFGADELDQLVSLADRFVVDSSEWREPQAEYRRLAELFDRVAVSDIAWTRGQPWREAIAALWPEIAEATSLRVAGPEADALLLAGWLGARLRRAVELEHEPAAEIELVAVDGRDARPRRVERKAASDLLSDQLDLFERDRLYEEAVWSFSSVPT